MVSFSGTYTPGDACELLRNVERLGQEALHLAGARNRQTILVAELFHAQDGNNILQISVFLQNLLHRTRRFVVLLTDDIRLQNTGGGCQRVNGRVNALLGRSYGSKQSSRPDG